MLEIFRVLFYFGRKGRNEEEEKKEEGEIIPKNKTSMGTFVSVSPDIHEESMSNFSQTIDEAKEVLDEIELQNTTLKKFADGLENDEKEPVILVIQNLEDSGGKLDKIIKEMENVRSYIA